MNLSEAVNGLLSPENFYHQVDSVTFYILVGATNEEHYTALRNLPNRVSAASIELFRAGDATSYHAKVLRAALTQYHDVGVLDANMPIFDVSTLD